MTEELWENVNKLEQRLAAMNAKLEDDRLDLDDRIDAETRKSSLERMLAAERQKLEEAETAHERREQEAELKRLEATLKDDGEVEAIAEAMLAALRPLGKEVVKTVKTLRAESQRTAELLHDRQLASRRHQELARQLGKQIGVGGTLDIRPLSLALRRLEELEGRPAAGAVTELVNYLDNFWRDDSPSQPQPEEDER